MFNKQLISSPTFSHNRFGRLNMTDKKLKDNRQLDLWYDDGLDDARRNDDQQSDLPNKVPILFRIQFQKFHQLPMELLQFINILRNSYHKQQLML